MIIVRLSGGLGNQLFQYAAGRRLALKHGVELVLDLSYYREVQDRAGKVAPRKFELDRFRIAARRVDLPSKVRQAMPRLLPGSSPAVGGRQMVRIWQQDYGHAHGPWFEAVPSHAYLYGFWRSERFFEPAAAPVREELRPVEQADLPPTDWLREASSMVAVHVRRGDFLAHLKRYRVVNRRYVAKAMAEFGESYGFAVFSDDPVWCRKNIHGRDVRIMPAGDAIRDLLLMSACAHQIIANSSFSWWAAWLNSNPDKRVIAPWPWFAPGYRNIEAQEILPESWQVVPI